MDKGKENKNKIRTQKKGTKTKWTIINKSKWTNAICYKAKCDKQNMCIFVGSCRERTAFSTALGNVHNIVLREHLYPSQHNIQ